MAVTVAQGVVVVEADAKNVSADLVRALESSAPKVKRTADEAADGYVNAFKKSVAAGDLDADIMREIRDAASDSAREGRRAGDRYVDGFDDDLDEIGSRIRREVDNASDTVGRSGQRAGSGWVDSFKGSFLGNALANVALGAAQQIGDIIGTGIRAAWDFGWSSINVASGLGEADTALQSIFGEGKGAIDTFAQGAARSIGQSELASKKAAQTFGGYGKSAGMAGNANAAFSSSLVTLASDFASFYDTSPEQAIEAIGAALRGESEPIRAFNVFLDDATLKSRALKDGLIETTQEALTPQQRVLAAYSEIMAQTADVQGDFARTNESLPNQQRELAAAFEDAKGKLGESLLPAMSQLVTFANDEFMPVFGDMIEKVGPELGDALIEAMPALSDFMLAFVDSLPELLDLGQQALPLIIEGGNILIPILEFLAGGFSLWFEFTNNVLDLLGGDVSVLDFAEKVIYLRDKMLEMPGPIGAMVRGAQNVGIAFSIFGDFVRRTGDVVFESIEFMGLTIASLPGRVQGAVAGAGVWLYNSGRAVIQGFISGIRSMLVEVGTAVANVVGSVRDYFPNSPAKKGPLSGAGWTRLKESGGAVIDQWAEGMREASPGVPFDLMGIASPAAASRAARPTFGEDAFAPGVSAPATAAGSDGVRVDLHVTSDDPELAGRQFARGMTRRLGVR